MGYRIDYSQSTTNFRRKDRYLMRMRIMISVCLLLFSVLVKCFWSDGCSKLQEYVKPEYLSETQIALETLFAHLQDGERFQDALTAFCVDILKSENTD